MRAPLPTARPTSLPRLPWRRVPVTCSSGWTDGTGIAVLFVNTPGFIEFVPMYQRTNVTSLAIWFRRLGLTTRLELIQLHFLAPGRCGSDLHDAGCHLLTRAPSSQVGVYHHPTRLPALPAGNAHHAPHTTPTATTAITALHHGTTHPACAYTRGHKLSPAEHAHTEGTFCDGLLPACARRTAWLTAPHIYAFTVRRRLFGYGHG